jgi:monothiol glutaredoxin
MMTDTIQDRIATLVKSTPVVLFMKGTPMFPQCGFSSTAITILDRLGVDLDSDTFQGVDVLSDPAIRQGVKEYSDWPTVPQLYIGGEFVGGSDIMMEMFQAGELTAMLEQAGISRPAA